MTKGFNLAQPMTSKAKRRAHPIGNYLMLLVATIGAYWLYSTLVVPSIEVSAPLKRATIAENVPEYRESTEHHRWFKPGDWEREPCAILHTAHGRIFFQDHLVEDPKTWFVKPFSLVLQREKDVDANGDPLPPLVLRCASGARLNFNSPILSKLNSSGNRLESALLEGAVELYRMNSRADRQDGMRIETSNVQITDRQILTIDDVAFWIGPNHGMGRNMRIHLTNSSPASSITRDFSRINGIKSLHMGFLSSLQIRPPQRQQSLQNSQASSSDRLLANDSSPIEITATGPFEFDMETHLARFNENVVVRKLDGKGDSLQCDDLTLQFKSKDGSRSLKLDAAADTEFELQTITATGKPAILQANSHNARVQAKQLSYNVQTQVVRAADDEQVDIRQGTSRFLASEIQYQLTNDNSIGALTALGPGILIRSDGNQSFRATWNRQLKVQRISTQQQLVSLDGAAKLKLDRQSSIESESMQFKVWQVPVVDTNNQVIDWEYQPGELVADGEVKIQSEELVGIARKLVAHWPANPRAALQRGEDLGRIDRQLQPHQSLLGQHSYVRRVSFDQPHPPARPETRRLRFNGKQIDIVLVEANQKTQMSELQIRGDVTVTQPSEIPKQPTFKVRGDSLKMIPQSEELFQVQINGRADKNASLTAQQLQLSGPTIVLDQQANRVWVNGSGNMLIQSDDAAKPAEADVAFVGGMVFDGQQIYFERDVVADIKQPQPAGQLQLTRANATAVSLKLEQRFDLQKKRSQQATDPKVVQMILKDRIAPEENQFKLVGYAPVPVATVVVTHQKLDRTGQLLERLKIASVHVEINDHGKSIVAYGPGQIEVVRHGQTRMSGLPDAISGRTGGGFGEFTFIGSKFGRQLVANTTKNQITIVGDTRSVYSPISSPGQYLDPDQPNQFPPQAVQLKCEHLDVSQSMHPYDGSLQSRMVATGNARIASTTYDTAADRIRYDEANDSLIVESATGREVVLRSRQTSRSQWKSIVGKRLIYRLSTKSARAEGVEQINAPLDKRP